MDIDVSYCRQILDGLQRHGRWLKLRLWFWHSGISMRRWDRILENLQGRRLTRRRHHGSDAGLERDTKSRIDSDMTRKGDESRQFRIVVEY